MTSLCHWLGMVVKQVSGSCWRRKVFPPNFHFSESPVVTSLSIMTPLSGKHFEHEPFSKNWRSQLVNCFISKEAPLIQYKLGEETHEVVGAAETASEQSHFYLFNTHLWKTLYFVHRESWSAFSNLGRKLETYGRQIKNKQRALHIHRYKSDCNCIFQKPCLQRDWLNSA